MNVRDWQRLQQLFEAALELPEAARGEFLDRECGANTALRKAVERLLQQDTIDDQSLHKGVGVAAAEVVGSRPTERIGERLGAWRITGHIADGGMGAVYMAERADGEYEIVAGERRWRAAQIAQVHEIPVLLRSFTDTEVLEVAIIENIQRADLNPVEEAAGYSQLMMKFGHTQEKLAHVLGKSRSHIANAVRLLNLPDEVQEYLREGKLSAGHARALITASDAAALARNIIRKGLSVRETERLAKKDPSAAAQRKQPGSAPSEKDADTKALETDLSAALSMEVRLDHKPGQENGALTIRYASLDDLDRLMALLSA